MKDLIENPSPRTLYMRAWREKNREKEKQYQASYHARTATDETRAAAIRRARAWREENLERDRATKSAIYQRNRNKRMEQQRAAVKRNPDLYREIGRRTTARRRARLRGAFGCCGICGAPVAERFDYDHIHPIAKGGSHSTDNLQLAHPRCNKLKSVALDFRMLEAA